MTALTYENESSAALGLGFRCGFLGFSLGNNSKRLKEFNLDLIVTPPSVIYKILKPMKRRGFIILQMAFTN